MHPRSIKVRQLRISPDNKYLLFTLADYGTFHIWHKSSDLKLIDLKTGALPAMAGK